MAIKTIWIVSANSSSASIFSASSANRDLTLVKKLSHPQGRLKNSDLVSDRPGHYQKNSSTSRGAFSESPDPKSLEADKFAREIIAEIEKGMNEHQFIGLIVVAGPHFYGQFHKLCPQQVQNKIKFHHCKEFEHSNTDHKLKEQLEHLLHENIADLT